MTPYERAYDNDLKGKVHCLCFCLRYRKKGPGGHTGANDPLRSRSLNVSLGCVYSLRIKVVA